MQLLMILLFTREHVNESIIVHLRMICVNLKMIQMQRFNGNVEIVQHLQLILDHPWIILLELQKVIIICTIKIPQGAG